MTYKPNQARMARLCTGGSRLPGPGQDPLREEEWRSELTEEFRPEGLIEHIWVEDIAYRQAVIEVIRAQIAGFRIGAMHRSYLALLSAVDRRLETADDERVKMAFYPDDLVMLEQNWARDFCVSKLRSDLERKPFAKLLGDMAPRDLAQLRQLQLYEHEEVRERDRIVNQLERRRRLVMRHAIEMVEARRRAGLPDDGTDAAGDALLLIEGAAAEPGVDQYPDADQDDVSQPADENVLHFSAAVDEIEEGEG